MDVVAFPDVRIVAEPSIQRSPIRRNIGSKDVVGESHIFIAISSCCRSTYRNRVAEAGEVIIGDRKVIIRTGLICNTIGVAFSNDRIVVDGHVRIRYRTRRLGADGISMITASVGACVVEPVVAEYLWFGL